LHHRNGWFFSHNLRIMSQKVKIISGPRDSGKTRAAAALASSFRREGLRVGGVLSEAEMRFGVKMSYAFLDLASGERSRYAVRRAGPILPGELAFEFLSGGLDFGKRAIRGAVEAGVDAIFVDELGPLERGGGGLWEAVLEARGGFAGEIILTVREGLLDEFVRRLEIGQGEWEMLDPRDPPPAS
jgi:nucleoside-triphosphatase THEP1